MQSIASLQNIKSFQKGGLTPFRPNLISGLRLWLDAKDSATVRRDAMPRMLFDGVNDFVDLGTNVIPATSDFDITVKYIPLFTTGSSSRIIGQGTTGTNGRVYLSSQVLGNKTLRFFVGHTTGTDVTIDALATQVAGVEYTVRITRVGDTFSLYLDGVLQGSQVESGVSVQVTNTLLGKDANGSLFGGVIYDLDFGVSSYKGYGNRDRHWIDLTSSNNGTVSGSPTIVDIENPRMNFDGSTQYVTVSGMTASNKYFGACVISAKVYVDNATAIGSVFALGSSAYRLVTNGTNWQLNSSTDTGVAVTAGYHTVSVTFDSSGNATSFRLDGVQVWTGTAPVGTGATTTFYIGARDLAGVGLFWDGSIWDVSVTGSSIKNFTLNGYGIQNSDWEDQVNSNDGVVVGSPTARFFDLAGGSGEAVYEWQDKSGNDKDATQATLSKKPIYFEDDYYLDFDGIDDGMDISTPVVPLTGNFTLELRVNVPNGFTSASNVYFISQYTGGTAGRTILGMDTSGNCTFNIESNSIVGNAINDGDDHIIRLTRSGNTFTLFLDDVSQGTFSFSGSLQNRNTELYKTSDISRFATGYVKYVYIYSKLLSSGELAKLSTYFEQRYPFLV